MADFSALLEGYRRFRDRAGRMQRERWAGLAEGQSPKVMVIACSDSRVDPAQIFDARPGEMFVVRNVANLVPPFEPDNAYHGVSAALEFAVTQLEVEELVVMGHGFCGGCAAALTGQFDDAAHGAGHFIAHWIDMLERRARRDPRPPSGARPPGLPRNGAGGRAHLAAQSAHLPLGARARGRPAGSSSTAPISPSPTASSTSASEPSGDFAPA